MYRSSNKQWRMQKGWLTRGQRSRFIKKKRKRLKLLLINLSRVSGQRFHLEEWVAECQVVECLVVEAEEVQEVVLWECSHRARRFHHHSHQLVE